MDGKVLQEDGPTAWRTDPRFDDIAELAAIICAAPAAMVGMLENEDQVPRAGVGIHVKPSLDELICRHTVESRGLLVIPDLEQDARTSDHASVTGGASLRFYAGMVLTDSSGAPLGTLCVMDQAPRPDGLTPVQEEGLKALAFQVAALLGAESERIRRGRFSSTAPSTMPSS